MGNIRYCRPSDIITRNAIITTSGTVDSDPDYDLTALYDEDPARPCKHSDTSALRLVFDFGSATRVDGVALPSHNLDAATVVSVQMNASNSWGAPTVNGSMTVGAIHQDGHRASPWIDLRDVSGYSASGFRYLSVYIPSNTDPIKLGELLIMAQLRAFERWPTFDGTKGMNRRFLESLETEYGVHRVHRRRIKQRFLNLTVRGSDDDYADLQALLDDCSGLAKPFFITGDHTVKTDGGLYARFTRDSAGQLPTTEEWFDVNPFTISVQEVSRSLPL